MKQEKESSNDRVRVPGQRSIRSTLLFRAATASGRSKEKGPEQRLPDEGKKKSAELHTQPMQLSDFLNHNLHSSSSVLPINHLQDQENRSTSKISMNQYGLSKSKETDNQSKRCHVIEDSVFKQFQNAYSRLGNAGSTRLGGDDNDIQICTTNNSAKQLKSRKRMTPSTDGSEVDHHKHPPSHLIVLGDDPKPKHTAFGSGSFHIKKPRPLYNHYENGNYERESFDHDEVGSSNVWEGIGSTTLGGLEWH